MKYMPIYNVSVVVIRVADGAEIILSSVRYPDTENALTLSKLSPFVDTCKKLAGVLFSILRRTGWCDSLLHEKRQIENKKTSKEYLFMSE